MGKKDSKISVRGALLEGKVISTKMPKTAIVEIKSVRYVPKYERYEKVRSKIKAHNPENILAKEGDLVKIGETRKLSKTKSFIITEIIKRDTK